MDSSKKFETIDEYIAAFPAEIQEILQDLRSVIKKSAPEASEKISYGMPTFFLKKNLVHFAAYKTHIGFYPSPSGIEAFHSELEKYSLSKGTIRFSIDEPLPLELISRIVKFRVEENQNK